MCAPSKQPSSFASTQDARLYIQQHDDWIRSGRPVTGDSGLIHFDPKRVQLAQSMIREEDVARKTAVLNRRPPPGPAPNAYSLEMAQAPTNPFIRPFAPPLRIPLLPDKE